MTTRMNGLRDGLPLKTTPKIRTPYHPEYGGGEDRVLPSVPLAPPASREAESIFLSLALSCAREMTSKTVARSGRFSCVPLVDG
jgi:hypothetical protein